jgi:branched-chain amino acid transport system ATP-binding protein
MRSGIKFWESLLNTRDYRKKEKASELKAAELLKFAGLDTQKDMLAGNLSHGYQRTLNLAIALGSDPEILMLDEPMAGLTPERVAILQDMIRRIRDKGCTIMVIEHNVKAVFSICDRIIVLDAGAKLTEGKPQEIQVNPEVIRIYLGG